MARPGRQAGSGGAAAAGRTGGGTARTGRGGSGATAASPDSTGAPSDAADARTLRDLARAALATGPRRSPDVTLAEITASGLTATVFGRGHDGETTERAEVHTWSWAELLAGLPKDLDAALFILAGGIGQWTGPRQVRTISSYPRHLNTWRSGPSW